MRLIDADALKKRMVNEPVKAVQDVDFQAEWFTRIADTVCHMIDMVDEAPTVAAPRWHRVEEELPSMDGYDWVLGIVTGEAGYLRFHKAVMMVSFDPQYKEWFIDEYTDAKITVSHWMELPEPPKEDA